MAHGQPNLPDIFNANAHYLNLLVNVKPETVDTTEHRKRINKACDKMEELLLKFEEPPSNISRIR